MRRYNPREIEPKWQKIWAQTDIYKADMNRAADKFYVIPMLPYPSGDLHIGHWYNFGPTDTVARFRRMLGNNVLTTIGFDAYGLPAENAAIKRGIQPAKWTYANIKTMTKQIGQIGASYDWSHSLATCQPDYYRWNQWLFLKLYKKGLAYRAKALVNWCPKDQTVLANEQVVGEDNVCERCGTPVVQKEMESWYFKITNYAERLLADLKTVDWPHQVKLMQENWIGKSKGALINFKIQNSKSKIEVFTTRPDTIFGATFIVLAPEHEILNKLSISDKANSYIEKSKRKTELERKAGEPHKTGVFSGQYAINPANKAKIPIWIADYVLMDYGTGAIMAVPAHDERDAEFAQKFDLPIEEVIEKSKGYDGIYTGEGRLLNSGKYDGMDSAEARDKISADFGKAHVNYKLRDWLISRQRYWGTPIPIVYCEKCGTVPVPQSDLPVVLPEDVEFELSGRSPLVDRADFVKTKCPKCGASAKRETDTMDTFVDSSWYYLRYLDNKNDKEPFDTELINKWMPMDHYIGGIEHAILHLLYARFITKFLHDEYGLSFEEPFKKLTNQGIILGPDGHKMSKSRGNVVSPDEQVASYGADSLRLYLMFMGPYEQGGPYDMGGIAGTRRFLERLWALVQEYLDKVDSLKSTVDSPGDLTITAAVHKTVKKVTKDLENLSFNTAIAAMMESVNRLYKLKAEEAMTNSAGWRFALETLTQLVAPLAPHIAEELWETLGRETSVHVSNWPQWDEKLTAEEVITLAVQVNGKVRSEVVVPADVTEQDAVKSAIQDDKIILLVAGRPIKKAIYVPGRLVSLVI